MHGGKTIITTKCLIGTKSNIYDGTFCKFVGNNAKLPISKRVFHGNKAQQFGVSCFVEKPVSRFPKNYYFLP